MSPKYPLKNFITAFLIIIAFMIGLGTGAGGILMWSIRSETKEICQMAQHAYPHPGDDAAALADFILSEKQNIQERNHTVWAAGRLRAKETLPALQKLYTGAPCQHEAELCQYELQKAIKRCGGMPHPPAKAQSYAQK